MPRKAPLPLPGVSAACTAKTLPVPCPSPLANQAPPLPCGPHARTPSLPCVFTALAAKAPPLPCGLIRSGRASSRPTRLRRWTTFGRLRATRRLPGSRRTRWVTKSCKPQLCFAETLFEPVRGMCYSWYTLTFSAKHSRGLLGEGTLLISLPVQNARLLHCHCLSLSCRRIKQACLSPPRSPSTTPKAATRLRRRSCPPSRTSSSNPTTRTTA